eukprot:2844572-Amphidinium_carterae.1
MTLQSRGCEQSKKRAPHYVEVLETACRMAYLGQSAVEPSAAGAIEGAWKIATGQLVSLSEQQFIDCDTNEMGCNGGVVERAFTYASTAHLCMEE